MQASLGAGTVQAHGILSVLGTNNLAFTVENLALKDLVYLNPLGPRLGTVSGHGRVSGRSDLLQGSLDMTGQGVRIKGHPFDKVQALCTFSPHPVSSSPFLVERTRPPECPGQGEQACRKAIPTSSPRLWISRRRPADLGFEPAGPRLHLDEGWAAAEGAPALPGDGRRPQVGV